MDHRVRAAVRGRGRLRTVWNATLYHIEDLPYSEDLSDMPDTFTPARKKIEAQCDIRAEARSPQAGELGLPAELRGRGEGTAVWERLPLAAEVKAAGPPEPHPDAALHFEVSRAARLQSRRAMLTVLGAVGWLWDDACCTCAAVCVGQCNPIQIVQRRAPGSRVLEMGAAPEPRGRRCFGLSGPISWAGVAAQFLKPHFVLLFRSGAPKYHTIFWPHQSTTGGQADPTSCLIFSKQTNIAVSDVESRVTDTKP